MGNSGVDKIYMKQDSYQVHLFIRLSSVLLYIFKNVINTFTFLKVKTKNSLGFCPLSYREEKYPYKI